MYTSPMITELILNTKRLCFQSLLAKASMMLIFHGGNMRETKFFG
jgi:hypothetical protein